MLAKEVIIEDYDGTERTISIDKVRLLSNNGRQIMIKVETDEGKERKYSVRFNNLENAPFMALDLLYALV